MNDFKEFQAKNLDIAINDACDYFNTVREKLEIDILEDAKSGVFGIIGARKARIRARRVLAPTQAPTLLPKTEQQAKPKQNQPPQNAGQNTSLPPSQPMNLPQKQAPTLPAEAMPNERKPQQEQRNPPKPRPNKPEKQFPKTLVAERPIAPDTFVDDITDAVDITDTPELSSIPRTPLIELNEEHLFDVARNVIHTLTQCITGDIPIDVYIQGDRLCISIDPEDSGLLIGREGQTLAAIEYIAARIITRQMESQIRVQIEVGDYRHRQDMRLHEFALQLAEKVRHTNKSCSTRPLSAYQRRIVHLALQEEPDLQTRSTGDGSLKRVVIMKAKNI